LALDVGLLKQESKLRGALSPCSIKFKKSNIDKNCILSTARTE